MSDELSMAIVELERDRALETVRKRLADGEDPVAVLDECRRGMTVVGQRFEAGDYFLAELLLSAEIFKATAASSWAAAAACRRTSSRKTSTP